MFSPLSALDCKNFGKRQQPTMIYEISTELYLYDYGLVFTDYYRHQ